MEGLVTEISRVVASPYLPSLKVGKPYVSAEQYSSNITH